MSRKGPLPIPKLPIPFPASGAGSVHNANPVRGIRQELPRHEKLAAPARPKEGLPPFRQERGPCAENVWISLFRCKCTPKDSKAKVSPLSIYNILLHQNSLDGQLPFSYIWFIPTRVLISKAAVSEMTVVHSKEK